MEYPDYTPDRELPPWLAQAFVPVDSALRQNRAAHAWLVSGAEGLGRPWLYRYWAWRLLCETGAACGQCRACRLLAQGSHPDVLWVMPEDRPTISVDQLRQMARFVWETPQMGRAKLVILDPAEAMTLAAANALLKTLEEPPAYATLVLGTASPGTVLPTIRSRCAQMVVPVPDAAMVREWLAGQGDQAPSADVIEAGLALGLAPFELLADAEGRVRALKQLESDWQAWLAGKVTLTELTTRWSGLDQGDTLEGLMRILYRQVAGGPVQDALQAVVAMAYERLAEIRRRFMEKRNLNPLLVWEHWLMQVRRDMKELK